MRLVAALLAAALAASLAAAPVYGQTPDAATPRPLQLSDGLRQALFSVVAIEAKAPPQARTAATLGAERKGHGVVIGDDGLILTVGYLIVEADDVVATYAGGRRVPAEIVAYDQESGFGLIRTALPAKVPALALGDSDRMVAGTEAVVAGAGGERAAQRVLIAARREFAGYWEYLLENALFASPPYDDFAGAPLFDREGGLVGIGSLRTTDAWREGDKTLPGNMFLPVARLRPILAELIEKGRSQGPARPWLGVLSAEQIGRVTVQAVQPGSPAAAAGLRRGDVIAGVAGRPVLGLADFYRQLWAQGEAGVEIVLTVERDTVMREIAVKSADRYKHLRLDTSL